MRRQRRFAGRSASAPSAGVMNSDASRLAVTSRLNSEIAVAMRPVVTPATRAAYAPI
jgi:hypothetical protein